MAPLKKRLRTALGSGMVDESEWVYAALRASPPGVNLEVGAHHGDPALMRFAIDGWAIHAFEPDPQNRVELERGTACFDNVTVVPKAVSSEPGTLKLYRSPESTGISSLTAFTDQHVEAGEVEVITLEEYLLTTDVEDVSLLKLDVEGYEKFVLDGYPWDSHQPRMVLLEFEDRKTVPLGYSWRDLADELRARGYDVLVSEWHPIERYGMSHRWRTLSRYPCDLATSAAWGNLVATRGSDTSRIEKAARRNIRRARIVGIGTRLLRSRTR